MENVAAYFLLKAGGNEEPSESDIKKVLSSVGIEGDTAMIKSLLSKIEGKSFDDLVKDGMAKLSSVSVGPSTASTTVAEAAPVEEEKAPEPEEESSEEESDDEMGLDLFD